MKSLELSAEQKKKAIASVQQYLREELDQDVGDLKAGLVLEFILKEVAPSVYNQAIADAQAYFRDRVSDLEGVCYHAEFSYWQKPQKR